jgi:hypothetical protein
MEAIPNYTILNLFVISEEVYLMLLPSVESCPKTAAG